jgi:hypothetical protein
LLKDTGYLTGPGESSRFEFGKNKLVIYDNIEDTIAPGGESRLYVKGIA